MKKFMMVLLAMSIVCIMAVGGTMSYLTYTDYDVNTMVVGNVKIEQLEQMRDENGAFVDLQPQGQKLYPYIREMVLDNGWYDTAKNAMDKIVSVKNTGAQAAYVRTVFAFEMKKDEDTDGTVTWDNPVGNDVILNANGTIEFGPTIYRYADETFGIDRANAEAAFVVGIYTYGEVAPGATSDFSLKQICLASTVGNEFSEAVGPEYEVLVLSQAVQTEGFASADDALIDSFGELTAENAASWFADVKEGNG